LSDDEDEAQAPPKPQEQEEGQVDTRDDFEKEYERLSKLYELDKAEEPENFTVLEIKSKINSFFKSHPNEKKIPTALLNEAFRWRLSQNDCQNRGYVLDGYPISYETAQGVFYITPKAPEKKAPVVDEETGEVKEAEAEEMDPEEYAKLYAPKFQAHIYPDSVIYLRGDDSFL